jgi:hypothetical protein
VVRLGARAVGRAGIAAPGGDASCRRGTSAAVDPARRHAAGARSFRARRAHRAEAKTFCAIGERPDLTIVYRAVDRDQTALDELVERSRQAGIWPPGVPTFAIDGRMLVGFDDAEHSGPALLALIDAASPPPEQVETTLFGTLSASQMGLPLFTLALGLLDGFNPCAMWVLLFLLSLLVRLQDRKRMALIGTFVLVSGAVITHSWRRGSPSFFRRHD